MAVGLTDTTGREIGLVGDSVGVFFEAPISLGLVEEASSPFSMGLVPT